MAETVDVVIVGSGPTGLTITNFLGLAGVRTLVVERNATTTDEPRAVSIDEESLRLVQAAGLYDLALETVLPGTGTRYYGIRGALLAWARGPNPPPYGHPIKSELNQPGLEKMLLRGVQRFSCVAVQFDTEVVSLQQDG